MALSKLIFFHSSKLKHRTSTKKTLICMNMNSFQFAHETSTTDSITEKESSAKETKVARIDLSPGD